MLATIQCVLWHIAMTFGMTVYGVIVLHETIFCVMRKTLETVLFPNLESCTDDSK
jgi:hypothetical protein